MTQHGTRSNEDNKSTCSNLLNKKTQSRYNNNQTSFALRRDKEYRRQQRHRNCENIPLSYA